MSQIKFDPNNYRIHNDRNKRVIRKSLEECGAGRSILVDKDNYLIAGNGVYKEAQELGIPVRVIETDGKELVVVKRNDLSSDDEKRKLLALADNHASDTSMFDVDLIVQDFSEEDLDLWEFSLDDLEVKGFEYEEEKQDAYTKKIVSPIYTPKGEKPRIDELCNMNRWEELMNEIDNSGLNDEERSFLHRAATRHIVFDYGKIAEYYAHASKEMQELMEKSALVIIDFDKAIEMGYVNLKEEIKEQYMEDHTDDEA